MTLSLSKSMILASLLILSACANDKSEDAQGNTDVTSEFLATVGDKVYSQGPVTAQSKAYPSDIAIAKDGTLKRQGYEVGNCTFIVTGKVDSVQRYSDGAHWLLRYTENDITMTAPSSNTACAETVSKYKFKNIPKTTEIFLCSYSYDHVDFACNGDKNAGSNWILKN